MVRILLYLTFLLEIRTFGISDVFETFGFEKTHSSCTCSALNQSPSPCNSYKTFFDKSCWKYGGQYVSNALSELKIQLNTHVFGQSRAINAILNHLTTHLNRPQNILTRSPLVLHFAGDFGVGKTLTASVISSTLFKFHLGKDPVDHYCTLLLSGAKFPAGSGLGPKEQEKRIQELRASIIAQVKRCKNSIIILNDLQKMDSHVFAKLEDLFEGVAYSMNDKSSPICVTKFATFILTSDLGSADLSRRWSYGVLEKEIKERFSLYTNFNSKLDSLVVHIPFKSLNKKDMKDIIVSNLLSKIPCLDTIECVKISQRAVDFLADQWTTSAVINKMNGRAFNKYIFPTFIERELQMVKEIASMSGDRRVFHISLEKQSKNKRANATKLHSEMVYETGFKPEADSGKNDL